MITGMTAVVALVVGQLLGLGCALAYSKWQDRKLRKETEKAMLTLGMNRASFPMCSPSRSNLTGEDAVSHALDSFGYTVQDPSIARGMNDMEEYVMMRNMNLEDLREYVGLQPIPAPEWMLPKKEAE